MVGCGQLEIVAEHPGGPVTIPLGKVLHVPKLERSHISERQASLMSGLLFVKSPTVAYLGTGKEQRDIIEVHRLLAHPSEHITRATAKATGIIITDE